MTSTALLRWTLLVVGLSAASAEAEPAGLCTGFGPQTPRDIASATGSNPVRFAVAGGVEGMNLCNIHFHAPAEHRGPGFPFAARGDREAGFRCDGADALTAAERAPPAGVAACRGVAPGDTIEVHWVYTSCDVSPGKGLGACVSDACANPTLRVEAQVFLVVNDSAPLDFAAFDYGGSTVNGYHQTRALPGETGDPVVFRGSTTGPSYSEATCSPLHVTWSVRPQCARLDIASLHAWCAGNAFDEDHAHGARRLVTAPELLAPID